MFYFYLIILISTNLNLINEIFSISNLNYINILFYAENNNSDGQGSDPLRDFSHQEINKELFYHSRDTPGKDSKKRSAS